MKKILIHTVPVPRSPGAPRKNRPLTPWRCSKRPKRTCATKNFEKARKGYQEIQEKSPDKSYDAVLMLRVADTYFGEEKYSEALVEYQAFLNYHPVNKDAAYAQYQIAMCNYKELTTIDRDPAPAHAVIREMRKLLEKYPKSGYEEQARKYIAICPDWIAEYELYVARFYYKKGSYKAAAGRCEKLLQDYPGLALGKGRALLRGPFLHGTRREGPGAGQVRNACAEISGHEGNGLVPYP